MSGAKNSMQAVGPHCAERDKQPRTFSWRTDLTLLFVLFRAPHIIGLRHASAFISSWLRRHHPYGSPWLSYSVTTLVLRVRFGVWSIHLLLRAARTRSRVVNATFTS